MSLLGDKMFLYCALFKPEVLGLGGQEQKGCEGGEIWWVRGGGGVVCFLSPDFSWVRVGRRWFCTWQKSCPVRDGHHSWLLVLPQPWGSSSWSPWVSAGLGAGTTRAKLCILPLWKAPAIYRISNTAALEAFHSDRMLLLTFFPFSFEHRFS